MPKRSLAIHRTRFCPLTKKPDTKSIQKSKKKVTKVRIVDNTKDILFGL
jgi:hypothetical protein